MDESARSKAKELAVYQRLGDFDRWLLRRRVRWICADPASWRLLRDHEQDLVGKGLYSWQVLEGLTAALSWYNREARQDRKEGLPLPGRAAGVLQVILVFQEMGPAVHRRYRNLICRIAQSGDNFSRADPAREGMTPGEFRVEAARQIAHLVDRWHTWSAWNPARGDQAERTLACLENIARVTGSVPRLTAVLSNIVPDLGLEGTSSLAALSRDFQQLMHLHARVHAQTTWWKKPYTSLFGHIREPESLQHILATLEALIQHPLVEKCIHYGLVRQPSSWSVPSDEVAAACRSRDWTRPSCGAFVKQLAGKFVERLVDTEMQRLWAAVAGRGIRWPFDKFTEHVPYEMRSEDWTADNAHNRSYWNWQAAATKEKESFVTTLGPALQRLFVSEDQETFEAAADLILDCVEVEEVIQPVEVPVAWERSIRIEEGYQHQVGFYDIQVPIAIPVRFAPHTFTFERLNLQKAAAALERFSTDRFTAATCTPHHGGDEEHDRGSTMAS